MNQGFVAVAQLVLGFGRRFRSWEVSKMHLLCCYHSAEFAMNNAFFFLRLFQHCTPLEHTPKPLPTGYKGIPFIVGERGIAERVCCNFLGFGGRKFSIQ